MTTDDSRTSGTAVLLEICVGSVADALAAEQGGADRVELCANLVEGGTTPSQGMAEAVLEHCPLPVMVMIRPRGGHFCFDPDEVDTMRREARALLRLPIAGIVIGALSPDGHLDESTCREMIELAEGRSVTFHRAFDQHANARQAIDQLAELGVDRILTSGQTANVPTGLAQLRQYADWADGRVAIMPGGGVRASNAAQVVHECGVREIHSTGSQLIDTPVDFWRMDVPMMAAVTPGDLRRKVTVAETVREIRDVLDRSL